MNKEVFNQLTAAIYNAGWSISELKEEYKKDYAPAANAIRTEYGDKTGAILLRLTPVTD